MQSGPQRPGEESRTILEKNPVKLEENWSGENSCESGEKFRFLTPRSRRPGATAANPARGDDAIASPGRRRRHATALICTTAAASAGSRVMPSRTLPRVLSCSKEQAHAQNLNATARFHCSRLAWNDEIIDRKSSLALSLPSFLPPSRASLNRKLAAGARVHMDPFRGGNGSMRVMIDARTWRSS